jgi:hypothetical protein
MQPPTPSKNPRRSERVTFEGSLGFCNENKKVNRQILRTSCFADMLAVKWRERKHSWIPLFAELPKFYSTTFLRFRLRKLMQ